MKALNLPKYDFKIISKGNSYEIFDIIRKKYIKLTPEEWVRQNFIMYLIIDKKYPKSFFSIEKKVMYNDLLKRTDILFYKNSCPYLIVECKSPEIKICDKVLHQAITYNRFLNAKYLVLTNGLIHYYCKLDKNNNGIISIKNIPKYYN
ncbi:MAG: restriction endonuclease subunit R [Flavobacteriales bacterium]|nr:restriction endonuclease subunit R [Flavobacteriales bacterium]